MFGVEVLDSVLPLMAVILVVVYTKGLRGFGAIAIGGIVGLNILLLDFNSGTPIMNPNRWLNHALMPGVIGSPCMYWSATFVSTSIVPTAYRKKFY